MSNLNLVSKHREENQAQGNHRQASITRSHAAGNNLSLPASITKSASKQTYFTIRFLVDRDRIEDAYRAYAYFRWVDDYLDREVAGRPECIAFIDRQVTLVEDCYQGQLPCGVTVEEQMLVDLIENNQEQDSGLQLYIRNMMAVMAFDANRRGRSISNLELDDYSRHLATAVTEALHYFIGNSDSPPQNEARYLAATAAHIVHMLRDTYEDMAAGYYNIPCELTDMAGIQTSNVQSTVYRSWVKSRIALARAYFEAGKNYLSDVTNLRCRIAGYAYIARFEYVLNLIERENYFMRSDYDERRSIRAGLTMGWMVFQSLLRKYGAPMSQSG